MLLGEPMQTSCKNSQNKKSIAHYRWHNEDWREKPYSNATPFSSKKHIIYSAVHIWSLLNVKSAVLQSYSLELVESTDLNRYLTGQNQLYIDF